MGSRKEHDMRIWPAALALALVLGLSLLAACGGGEDEEGEEEATATAAGATTAAAPASDDVDATGTPQASATSTPREGSPTASPSGGGSAQEVGCEFPSDIESFRFEMTLKANLPTTPEAETPESEEPLGDFLGALTGLMGDMKMEGSIIVPDRSSMQMTIGGHEFGSFVQIGSQSWAKVAGLTDWTEEPASEEGFLFSPIDFCESAEEDISSALSGLDGEEETVNGIQTVHYHIDKADLPSFGEFLGGTEDTGDLPEEFAMDIWLAEDGDWPVRMNFEASGDDGDGQPLSFEISVEFKDFNDSSIKIEPPT
jgi:hypothetical protein